MAWKFYNLAEAEKMLAILDYGAGNQTSVQRAFAHLGIQAVITADPVVLEQSLGIIFPGVGAAGQAMGRLAETGMDKQLKKLAAMHKPLLGVCLGCQILLDNSEEDNAATLGIVRGTCRRFDAALKEEDGTPIRIPHMGWNGLIRKKPTILLRDIPENAEFYFVHSYYTSPEPDLVLATSKYGQEFCAIYGYDGLWAVQFHPEKSGAAGLTLLNNFYTYCMECHNAVQTPDRLS